MSTNCVLHIPFYFNAEVYFPIIFLTIIVGRYWPVDGANIQSIKKQSNILLRNILEISHITSLAKVMSNMTNDHSAVALTLSIIYWYITDTWSHVHYRLYSKCCIFMQKD